MGKSKKKDKSEKINFLRQQYEAFLEDDRKRRERNEYILQRLDKMRSSVASPAPHGNEPATVLKTRATNVFSETPKMSMQTYSPLPRRSFLPETSSNIMPPQNSQNQIISKDMTENNIEQTILKEISKKYILIPKIRSPYYAESEINETSQDQHDNEWKSKYDILEKLNSVDDTDDKSCSANKNKREIINKGDKNFPLFDKPTKDENGSIYTKTKVSWNDDEKITGNSKYNHESPVRLRDTTTTFSNDAPQTKAPFNNYVKTINSQENINEPLIKKNIDINNEIINNYENDIDKKYLSADENYDKDTENEKNKISMDINNSKLNEQHLDAINKSPEIKTSRSFEELKQQENITISQNIEPSQYNYFQSDLECSAPESNIETHPTVTQEFDNQQYNTEVTNIKVCVEEQDLHNTQQYGIKHSSELYDEMKSRQTDLQTQHLEYNKDKYLRNLNPDSVISKDQINNAQSAQQSENKLNPETTLNYPTPINASQDNNNHQGWTEQQNVDQAQVEHLNQYPQAYSQEQIDYNQVAYSEPPYDQYDYSQIPKGTEQNFDPNKAYDVTHYEQGPNQSAVHDHQSTNVVPEEHQSDVTQDQYLNNDGNQQYEGHYQQSDVLGEYQQDITQGQYLTNEGQNQYQQENIEGQYVPSEEQGQYVGQYQQSDELSTSQHTQPQITSQNIQGQYQQSDELSTVQNIQPQDTGQRIPSDGQGQYLHTDGQGQYVPTDGQGQYIPTDGQGQYVPTDGQGQYEGQYQHSDGLSTHQYLPTNGQDQHEAQYQQPDGQGEYEQPVQGQYLPTEGQYEEQYQQSDETEQYPQNNEERQYLPNDGKGQYQYETDQNYTQQPYAEYNAHEVAAPADLQQAPIKEEQDRPEVANIEPIVANAVAQ